MFVSPQSSFFAKYFPLKKNRASASVLLLAFKMRQWDAGKKQGGTLQGGFLDFFRSWDPLTHFELFAFCFMLKSCLPLDAPLH